MTRFPILLYGATGYTGRLICYELKRTGAPFAIAGRSWPRLVALQRELDLPAAAVHRAEIGDHHALVALAAQTRVILSCVGPFSKFGRPVQDAALQSGCHCLDIAGEYAYMRTTYQRDEEARARGVALISAVGFDVVPTDAAAVLACRALPKATSLRIAFAKSGGASRGTLRSMFSFLRTGMAYQDGALVPEPLGVHRWTASLPAPFDSWQCLSVPWGDLASAPRSTGVRNLRTYAAFPSPAMGPLQAALPALRRISQVIGGPLRGVAERGVALLPEGPSSQARRRSHIAVVAEAVDESGARRRAWVRAGDGYQFTAGAAALCAQLAAAPAFTARGALTPSQAFGAEMLLNGLGDQGVRWGLE